MANCCSRLGPLLLAGLLGVATAGCQKWVTVERNPVEGTRVVAEKNVLVVMKSGDRVQLSQPIRVENDSLHGRGRTRSTSSWSNRREMISVALADIEELREERRDHTATGISFGAGVLAVLAIGGLITLLAVGAVGPVG